MVSRAIWSLKYGLEKSTDSLRASVMVIPEIAASHWSVSRAAPDSRVSKFAWTTFFSLPRSLAISSASDMSKPTISPSFSNSNGA